MNEDFLKKIAKSLSVRGLSYDSAVAHGRGVITVKLDTSLCRTFYLRSFWRIRRSRKNKNQNHATGFGYFDHNYPNEGMMDIHRRLKKRLAPLNGVRIKNKPTFL